MAFSVDLASNLPTKDYIVAFGHLKLIRNKNNYGRNRKNPYDIRRKCMAAKVQKNTVCNVSKRNNESSNGEDHISENTAGTSNQTNSETRLEHSGNHEESGEESYVNLKLLSKSNTIEFPTEEPSTSIKAEPNESVIQQRNVQQVQLLNIKPDLCKEVNSPPKSVASARPIPTLGQIYQQDPNDDTTTFGGWYLESLGEYSNLFEQSVETTSTSTDCTTTTCNGLNNYGNNQQFSNMNSNNVTNVSLMTNTSPTKVFKTTNENVSEWLSAELDHPTRDNEFDNNRLSVPTLCYNPNTDSNNRLDNKNSNHQNDLREQNSSNGISKTNISEKIFESSHISLSAQPTIILKTNEASDDSEPVFVLPKTNTDFKEKDYYPDFHKPLMFHSTPVTPKRREPITKSRTASYVEYPSEVLQKTTNFESDGGDNLSSIVETDHGLSSSWMFNRYTDSSTLSGVTWSKLQISQDTLKESFKNSRLWKSDTFDEKRKTGDSEKNSNHDYLHHYCWKKEIARKETNDQTVRNYRERCNKCHKYRQPPKKKGPFRYLRKRMAMGICRHRLNRVWKKTAAKWAHWSKSPSKFRRLGMMNYLQKSIIWDNANVQTTIFVYHETGTDAVAREQKSAEITASIKLKSCSSYKNGSSKLFLSPNKHDNVGSSIFPFLQYSSNNAVVFGRYPSKSSFREALGGTVKEIRSINTQCSQSLEKDKLSQQLIQNSRLKQAASQDAYTQVFITCNNADTNIVFNPMNQRRSSAYSQGFPCNGVDTATDAIIPDKTSQHSINVMTSTAVLQRLTHNETQVSPAESMWKVSTGILVQELYRDAKSSVVTDTSVPRRNLDATLVTADGKVLTCTGTKITSVSSADIQAPSILSRTSRQYAVNTATSRVVNQDRSTAPSLHRCDAKDVSLETENIQAKKSEKATSQMILTRYSDIGLSASNIVKHNSINCGSHQLTHSFGAETQPQCYSVITNTDEEPKKPSVQDVDVSSCSCCVTNEDSTQYSSYIKNGSLGGGGCQIGRSRLISVRALFPEATDDGAQAQPSRCSAETKTLSNKKISASMFTSQLGLEQRYHPYEATSDEGKSSALKETKISSRDNKIVSSNKATGPGSQKPSKQSNRSACVNTNSKMNTKKSSKITNSLDNSKWIKESVEKHTGKSSLIQASDIETIVKVSEVAVRQSLQRASDIANSAHRTCSKQIHKLSKVLLNSDVNCVTTKTYEISNKSVTTTGSGRKAIAETEKKPCKLLTMDKITSGNEVVVRETKASVLQAQTNVRDAATDCLCARRSATALTSRHVLPKKTLCVAGGESNPECLFVYDRPRCVVHNASVDVAVQIQTQKEIRPKRSHSQHSIAVEAMLPCQVCCYRRHGVAGEALTPKEYKSLYEATRLMMKEGCDSRSSKTSSNSSSFDKTVKYEEAMKMRSQMTSCLDHLPTQCCCMRCTQIAHTDNRSIQAVEDSFLICPKCHIKITDLPKDAPECIEDYVRASLGTSCRYYSNLLAMKLGRVRDNFIKHLAPSVVDSIYPLTVPEYYTEACTMKPSGRMDENCQVKIPVTQMKSIRNMMTTLTSSCVLTPTVSDTDLTAHDKRDLRAVYYILSGIEGRIRRLKNNLHD
ncbi:uncharacterized protein LOC116765454 isoform X3 [Danaus plexippus]|uniref:uncharacterized protein LOC116765454 isoform X3 n=1 Tax=Danaus plexippus TaxID=13037 RepID=UPI002AB2CD82|nr:uncharacterized protein LOC116765454 isoform X3 [Danaus plexippus]